MDSQRNRGRITEKKTLPRKRRCKHSVHTEHPLHVHFFCHGFVLPPHQGLQCPATADAVLVAVVVLVTVVVLLEVSVVRVTVSVALASLGSTLPFRHEQQGSLVTPSAQRSHSN